MKRRVTQSRIVGPVRVIGLQCGHTVREQRSYWGFGTDMIANEYRECMQCEQKSKRK